MTVPSFLGAAASPGPTTWGLVRERPHSGLAIATVVLLYLAQALWWGAGIARFDAPDEPEHFELVRFIADHGRYPVHGADLGLHLLDRTSREIVHPPRADPVTGRREWRLENGRAYAFRYGYEGRSGGSYVLAGAMVAAARATGVDDDLRVARCASALTGAAAVAALGLLALWLRPDRPELHVLVPGCLGLLPQFVFCGAYVNGDAFAVAAAVTVAWRALVGMRRGWTQRDAVLLGLAVGLAFHAKVTAHAPALVGSLAVLSAFRTGPGHAVRRIGAAVAAAGLVASPWVVFSLLHYGSPIGAPPADGAREALRASLPVEFGEQVYLLAENDSASARGQTWWGTLRSDWTRTLAKSTFGFFGWMDRPLDGRVYFVTWRVAALAGVGAFWTSIGWLRRRTPPADAPFLALLTVSLAAEFVLALHYTMTVDYQPQGRYLLPAFPAIALGLSAGLASWTGSRVLRWCAATAVLVSLGSLCVHARSIACGG